MIVDGSLTSELFLLLFLVVRNSRPSREIAVLYHSFKLQIDSVLIILIYKHNCVTYFSVLYCNYNVPVICTD